MNLYFDKDNRGRDILIAEDAKIIFTNFRGQASKYNAEGHRNFCLVLTEEIAEVMRAAGWNIKYTKPKNDEYEPEPYTNINISWALRPPVVTLITSKNRTNIDEDLVGQLDTAEIRRIDIAINPSTWTDKEGNRRIKGYVNSMNVTLYEDPIRRMARESCPDIDEELPF